MRLKWRVEELEEQVGLASGTIRELKRKVAFLMCDHCPCQPSYDGYGYCCLCHMPVKKEASK